MRDSTAKHLSQLHALAYRLTSGVVGRRLVNNDMLLLRTVGRRTGKVHEVPLLYLESDSGYVVFASWGGRDRNPEWYLNLEAQPRTDVQVRGERVEVHARTLSETERSVWWDRAVAAYVGYAEYQSRTDRVIPVVMLEFA